MIGRLIRSRPSDPGMEEERGDPTEATLVAACAKRDGAAMGTLFERHGEAVHRFLWRLCGGGADVDDLTHATFLAAFRSAANFRRGSQVRTWLFGIALNVSRHHQRGESRRRAFLRAWAEHPKNDGTRPDRLAEGRQLVRRLEDALAALPPDLRAAYLLCDVEDLRGAEAAEALGIPTGTLGRRLHQARKALRAAIEGSA